MEDTYPFSIESFYQTVGEGKLMAVKCRKCGATHLPPRPLCRQCLSQDLEWVELEKRGKLLTYTIIHIAPVQFQSAAPYIVGVVELDSGVRLPGIIREVEPDKVQVGMQLMVDFGDIDEERKEWPSWPTYFFRPTL